jgi:hypothetical protein
VNDLVDDAEILHLSQAFTEQYSGLTLIQGKHGNGKSQEKKN